MSLVAVTSIFFFKVPTPRGYFCGDDYLLYEAHNTTWGYSSSFWSSFYQVGSGKFRPLFTPVISLLLSWNGNSYSEFHRDALLLLFICSVIFAILCYQLTRNYLVFVFSPLIIISSRFIWYNQSQIHGIMELLALMWFLIALVLMFRWTSTRKPVFLITASLAFTFSSFTHERYLLAPIAIWSFLLFCAARKKLPKIKISGTLVLLIGPVLNWFLKVKVLGINFLAGGGEAQFVESSGLWIIHHAGMGILGVLGFSNGDNDYFSTSGWGLLDGNGNSQFQDVNRWIRIIIVFTLIIYALWFVRRQAKTKILSDCAMPQDQFLNRGILIFAFLATLLPASTVISRTEGRWLQAPEICFWLIMISLIPRINKKSASTLLISVFAVSQIISISTRPSMEKYLFSQNSALAVMASAEQYAPKSGAWNLNVISNQLIPWQFAYGRAFSQLEHPPITATINGRDCSHPCLQIDLTQSKIKIFWNQSVNIFNRVKAP